MKIRSQTIVYFVPLFLVFVLANGLYYLSVKSDELDWGLQESMQATAVTIKAVLEERGKLAGVSLLSNLFTIVERREERNRFFAGIQINDTVTKKTLVEWCASTNLLPFFSLSPDEATDLHVEQRYFSRLSEKNTNLEIIALFDTTEAEQSIQAAFVGVAVFSGVAIVCSILISIFIAAKISKPVSQMTRFASNLSLMEAQSGTLGQTRIKEFDDLAGTLETVQSVVVDTVRSTQRRVVENEQTRDLSTVQRFMSERLTSSLAERIYIDGVRYTVGMCFPAGGGAGQFLGRESDWLYCGSIKIGKRKNPERIAHSLSEVIREMLSHTDDPTPCIKTISKMYESDYFCFARLGKGAIRLVRFENGTLSEQSLLPDFTKAITIVAPENMSGIVDDVVETSWRRGVEDVLEDTLAVFSDQPELCVISIFINSN